MADAVQLARRVLVADGQPFVTLSLAEGLPPVTEETAVSDARRNYMRLAGVIHPDRLQGSFDKATEAFQCLVRAFECFADPKARKKAATSAAKKASAVVAAAARPTSPGKKTRTKKARKPPKKQQQKRETPESDEEEEGSEAASEEEVSAAEEEAWEEWAAADTEPEVSTNRTPIGQPRVGDLYRQTTIGCPKCRSQWEPDSRPQYSLFMGHWGKKVHCQLCLFEFGCATALHNCPHCSAPFDYDVSMYDELQTCKRCKKQFGFPYYPVNQHLIDQIALEEWRERKDREKAAQREARARARHDDGAESEKTQLLVGTCIMDEECPLCHARVKSKHRNHVLECLAKSPEERAAAGKKPMKAKPKDAKAVQKPAPKTRKAAPQAGTAGKDGANAAAPIAAKKAAPKASKAKAPPAQRKRRRGGSGSDDSESEASLSVSEDEDISSESSFSDDDDDDDSD
ncbi:hypothetical protein ABB37_09371 [Leptomonas pyrrhocoris]|uniref:J domain-containing protein n=1 Tax=Leptomonas pyrrhocoris TaxID=157538 RepID=A0A0N0VCX7_LEPPY|nr:hypothetical protein ABB37_09371 [Leptomonas pyrrhocoris]XP_015652509.1 hypothetical protein ABB37_09371 [Leptomonas pyrrhocoris]XP_015652510.1 hypothetical protein ABB37_09371 [Leptomonas pyrrhocoris]KPA74069.1 hypothetical protein ABB37_09371 [Leptomonas pyrrhocoris]KPA74070.1 hypothetical protein ABB37_09371 [Leptomonas pyrrhocoris]KPA74071.1 hypothetical protein ABB37_09371 [Leptomonas pyrrhocoris]|eukprot:XP_015652508.1 hypothetical protein ABB37_09371 [Leptomonas pyrrhocoris]